MKQFLDLRIIENWAHKYLGDDIGEPMFVAPGVPPLTRRVVLEIDDPLVETVKKRVLDYERRTGDRGFCGVYGFRHYDPEDYENAELLLLIITSLPEIFGGQFGTEYDDSDVCPKCAAGRTQVSPLRLNANRLPKKSDLAATVTAGEWVVSERLAEVIWKHKITGCHLEPIVNVSKKARNRNWFQLVITETAGEAVPPTKFAIDYFHEDQTGKYVCAEHGLLGLYILTEPYISRASRPRSDIAKTRFRYGRYAGWLVPHPLLMISPRFMHILRENKIKGYQLGVVHLV